MDYIDLTDPNVRAGMEYLDAHATHSMRQTFLARHPELLIVNGPEDVQNEAAIYGRLQAKGLPPTTENLEICFQESRAAGELFLPDYSPLELEAFERKNPDTGKHVMTTAQMRAYLEKTRQGPPPSPPNMADFLPTAGGRAMDTILNRGQK
jgi:hypothetical protein